MKKLMVILLTSIGCATLHALPMSNPSEAGLFTNGMFFHSFGCYDLCDPCFTFLDAWSLRAGFYGDYVFNRHMEVKGGGEIEQTRLYTNAGYLVVNFCNRLDVFATLGATNLWFQGNESAFPRSFNFEENIAIYFSPQFSWSVGARAILWELGSFGLGCEGQFFKVAPRLDHTISGAENHYTSFSDDTVCYKEWQVGLGAVYRFEIDCPEVALVPYIGVSYSSVTVDTRDLQLVFTAPDFTLTLLDMQSKKHWSYSVGATLTFFEVVGFTVEGRFAGEKALYVNGEVRF